MNAQTHWRYEDGMRLERALRAILSAGALVVLVITLGVLVGLATGALSVNTQGTSVGLNVGSCGVYVNKTSGQVGSFCGDY